MEGEENRECAENDSESIDDPDHSLRDGVRSHGVVDETDDNIEDDGHSE